MATLDPARLAELARQEGRLGLDTEFMPEGRYKPLLCLVQIAVGDEIAVLDPLDGLRPRAARRGARRPGGGDPRARRPPGRGDPAPGVEHDVHQRVRHAGRGRLRGLLRAGGLQRPAARRAADPAAQDGELHALGRAAADRRAAALRARRRRAPAWRWPTRSPGGSTSAGGSQWAREECRGDRRGDRRARSRGGVAAAAARHRAGPARPRGGARAGRVARAHRRQGGPAGRLDPARPDRRRAGQAPSGGPARALADPRRQPRRRAAPRGGRPGRDRARPRRPSRSAWTRASGCRPRRSTGR